MNFYNILGTISNIFSLGKNSDKVSLKNNNGVLEGQDNGGNYTPVIVVDKENVFTKTNEFPQVGIGGTNFSIDNPESLLINTVGNPSVTATGIISDNTDYIQVNMQNSSDTASSDYVATADNGTEVANYVDMGINGSNYTDNYVGIANDGYLFTNGGNMIVGTVTGGKDLIFFTNGADSYANEKMRIDYQGIVTCQNNIISPDGTANNHLVTLGQLNTKQNYLGNVNGIVKGDGVGSYTNAVSGTDYLTPTGNGSQLTGITKTQVGLGNVPNTDCSTTVNITDSVNKRFITDAQQTVLQNTSGTNTGDETTSTIKTKLGQASATTDGWLSSTDWSSFNEALTLGGLTDVVLSSPQSGDILKYNGAEWVNGSFSPTTNAGAGINFFPCDDVSDVTGYNVLAKAPQGSEEDETASVNNNKVLIDKYISASGGLGGSKIDAGIWTFNTWGYASNLWASTQIVYDVYKRTTSGTETLLFSVSTSDLGTSLGNYIVASAQPEYTITSTDRLVFKVYGNSSGIGSTTVHFIHGGTEHYSYASSPLVVRHNDLDGLQGGQSGEYYHLTSSQMTVVGNTSGTNTGDETTNSIKTKLGTASASTAGYLTSTDWSTFNSKLSQITGTNLDNIFTSNGFLIRTGTNTYSIDTNSYLTSTSSLNASNLSSGTVNDLRLSSNVTLQGNTFNGASQLVQLNSSSQYPAKDGSLITNLSKTQVGLGNVPNTDCTNATNITSGTLANARLTSSVTLQGNNFNGVSQLVQTNASGYLPALNGSLLTGITASQVGALSTTLNLGNIFVGNSSNIATATATNTAFNQNFETSTANIKADGVVSIGSSSNIPRADHVHPIATTRNNTGTFVEALNSGTQSLAQNTLTKVTFPTESTDVNNEFSSNTFTSAIAQRVLVIADIATTGTWGADSRLNIYIYVNGASKYTKVATVRNNVANVQICAVLNLAANDTVEIYAMKSDGGNDNISGSTLMIAQQY